MKNLGRSTGKIVACMFFGVLVLVFTFFLISEQMGFIDSDDIFPSRDSEVVYGPVVSDMTSGMYSILWITQEPVKSSVNFEGGKYQLSNPTRYHYYVIDRDDVNISDPVSMMHGKYDKGELILPQPLIPEKNTPPLPFPAYGEVEGLSQNEGFVIIEVEGETFIALVKDGRWGIDLPPGVTKDSEGTITVVKEDQLFTTDIDLSYVQPAQTIVLNLTKDRIRPQTSNRDLDNDDGLLASIVNKVYACEGDVGEWQVNCPNGDSFTENDACTQEMFMETHDNGYDQWAYEACGCPMEGYPWTAECVDGTTFTEEDMCSHDLFYRVHGRDGYKQWQIEACQDHGGALQIQKEQENASERTPFEKTPPTPGQSSYQPGPSQQPSTPQPSEGDKYICCWSEQGSYAGPLEDSEVCLETHKSLGYASTTIECSRMFEESPENIQKRIEEQQPQPSPSDGPSTPIDPTKLSNDLQSYNSEYPSKEESLQKLAPFYHDSILYWSQLMVYWGEKRNIDPNILAIIMSIESCGNPQAQSYAGATGLFQVMPFHFTGREDPWDPDTNADAATEYLNFGQGYTNTMQELFGGYNAGYGTVKGKPVSSWPSESQTYVRLAMPIWDDVQAGRTTSPGYEAFLRERGGSCDAAWNLLSGGQAPTNNNRQSSQQTSSTQPVCYERDTQGRCATNVCDDKLGESCTKGPDSCVFGAHCVAGKCVHYPPSNCPERETQQSNESPPSNNDPVPVNRTPSSGEYPVIEYNENKGTGNINLPAEYVVLHWTASPSDGTAEDIVTYFRGNCPGKCTAANYIVERDGTLHYLYPVGQRLYNAKVWNLGEQMEGYINSRSISFENVGTGNQNWSDLRSVQAMANVQEIKRHVDNGNLKSPEELKVIGHFQAYGTTNSDPGEDFVAKVCSQLHKDGYMVRCNYGVDSQYHIGSDRALQSSSSFWQDKLQAFRSFIHSVNAQEPYQFEGPGMYKIEFDGYELETSTIYLSKDIDQTQFFEDRNGNGYLDTGESLNIVDRITKLEKVSDFIPIEMTNSVNLISFPVLPEGIVSAAGLSNHLNELGADVLSISRMHHGEWQTLVVRDGDQYSPDYNLKPGEVYFVKVKHPTTIMVDTASAEGYDTPLLVQGWNTVVLSDLGKNYYASDIQELFEGQGPIKFEKEGRVDSVLFWTGTRYEGVSFSGGEVYGKDFILLENQPYWVRVK